MSYELRFHPDALEEWRKLDNSVRDQFKSKLAERLQNPRVPASKLSGQKDRFKIKLKSVGYRLIYEVRDAEIVVVVVAVGKRERNAVYKAAVKR
ncbi:MAG: type II toxin-antitoxin system RelE/ParE family toxin [Sulfuricella sp.]|nr:type II toxin-antitoxin system RelE/ParE family toxin [Sulfuricella sp.]